MIRVLVVDDHVVVRSGLARVLEKAGDIEVVAEAADGHAALAEVEDAAPDVVLMDLSMPGMDGIEATRRILEDRPGTRIVALSSFSDRGRVVAMLDAGAIGYLLKDSTADELVAGVRSAAAGGAPLAPTAASVLLRARLEPDPRQELTPRETQVLDLVARGWTNRRIAAELAISEATVKAHLTHVYHVLEVPDRTSAALRAIELGLASSPAPDA